MDNVDVQLINASRGQKKNSHKVTYFDNKSFNNFDLGGYDTSAVKGQFKTGCADPYIMRYNGMYYLYVTTSGLDNFGLKAWKSKDLLHWEKCQGKGLKEGYVISDKDDNGRYTQNAYAPEVYYFNGKFYMIISPGPAAVTPLRGHRILVSDNPEGPFEAHSEQIDTRIDGTLLIDDDESIYFAHATPFGITIHEFNNMKELGEGALIKASDGTGAWTEGPGILKVRGWYYLTYTGCHYQTPGYQVILATTNKLDKTNIQTVADSFIRAADRVVLLNADKDEGHVGLGHSINFLGPDLDSYYICYHNLDVLYEDGMTHRSFNIDRLLINNGMMTSVNNTTGTVYPKWPRFQSYGLENLDNVGALLSKDTSNKRFSAEFNSKRGGACKYLFSYENESNYAYIEVLYNEKKINLVKVSGDKETIIAQGQLKYQYNINDNQTIRVAYDGTLNVYFNNMLKISVDIDLNPGKIGYLFKDNTYEVGYTAISDEANGSSDRHEVKQALADTLACDYLDDSHLSPASGMKQAHNIKGDYSYASLLRLREQYDYVRYALNFKESDDYGLLLTLPKKHLGKSIAVALDDEDARIIKLPSPFECEDDVVKVFVKLGHIEQGTHELKIQNIEHCISFVSFKFLPYKDGYQYENACSSQVDGLTFVTPGYHLDEDNKEFVVDGRRDFASLSHQRITDCIFEADIRFDEVREAKSSIGLMFRQNNYAYSDVPHQDFKDANTHIQGYYLEIKENVIRLNRYNFGDVKSYPLIEKEMSNMLNNYHHYKVEAKGNTFTIYMDGKLLFTVSDPISFPIGACALYSYRTKGAYKNIKITALK